MKLVAGSLSTTLHPTKIADSDAQSLLNCNTDRAIWELDLRYRQFQAPFSSPSPVQSFQQLSGNSRIDLLLLGNQKLQRVNITETGNSDGSVNSAWIQTERGTGLSTGEWYSWQYDDKAFFVNSASGIRFIQGGTNELQEQWLSYDYNNLGNASLIRPPYVDQTFTGATITAEKRAAIGSGYANVENEGVAFGDHFDPNGNWYDPFGFSAVLAAPVDCSHTDYFAFGIETNQDFIDANQGGKWYGSQDWQVQVYSSIAAKWFTLPMYISLKDSKRGSVFCWLGDIGRSDRASITKYRFSCRITWNGPCNVTHSKIRLGGTYKNGTYRGEDIQDAIFNKEATIRYCYRYVDGANKTSASVVEVGGGIALGDRYDSALPYMGTHIQLAITPYAVPPYNAASVIEVYRQVGTSWYRVDDGTILNTGTPTYLDNITPRDISTSPASDIVIGTQSNAQISVPSIVAGSYWKGSNVYFRSDGTAFFSRVGNFKDVLWDTITQEARDGDIGRPRTMKIDFETGLPVIAAIGRDALYMFTNYRAFAVTGDTPVTASFPRPIPGIKGVVGPRAAAPKGNGAIFGSWDGLYFVEVPAQFLGIAGEAQLLELTKDLRPSWLWLLGTTPSLTSVCACQNQVWAFNQDRYLHLTREGKWIAGQWANGKYVFGSAANDRYGITLGFTDGSVGVIGAYLRDGGTDATGNVTGGTAPSWTYRTKRFTIPSQLLGATVLREPSNGNITLTAYSERSTGGVAATYEGASSKLRATWQKALLQSGIWYEIEVTGSAGAKLADLDFDEAPAEAGRSR